MYLTIWIVECRRTLGVGWDFSWSCPAPYMNSLS
jgi:hypothetical protein